MKNILFLLIPLLFLACSDTPTINIDRALLLGTWEPTELYTDDGKITQTGLGLQVTAKFEYEASNFAGSVTFNENPDAFNSDISVDYTIITTVAGQMETQEVEIENYLGGGSWTIDGDQLILDTGGDDPQTWKVLEINASIMRLRTTEEFEANSGGIRTESSATVFLTLER